MARPADISDEAERALRERIQQRQLAQAQPQRGRQAAPTGGRTSVFQRLGGRPDPPAGGDRFQERPEMTPRKVERGRAPGRGSDASEKPASHSQSGHMRRSASRGSDDCDSKRGKRDSGPVGAVAGKDRKVVTGIDWSTAAIEKPARKNPQHPSFKPDHGGTSKFPPEPKIKSAVVLKGTAKATGTSGRRSQTPGRSPRKEKVPPGFKAKDREQGKKEKEKEFVRDQAHHWIARRGDGLDPKGYAEETNSLRFFGHHKVLYGLEMVAIIDWAREYLDLGMVHPLPTLPQFLFSSFVASRQTTNGAMTRDESIYSPADDIRERFRRAWVLTAAVLQFWTDEQSILDGALNGGRVRPTSALARYVMDKLNPVLPKDLTITWDQVVERTPWVRRRLNCTEEESRIILRQPIPVPGEATELELATEAYYKRQVVEEFTAAAEASSQRSAPPEGASHSPKGRGCHPKGSCG